MSPVRIRYRRFPWWYSTGVARWCFVFDTIEPYPREPVRYWDMGWRR